MAGVGLTRMGFDTLLYARINGVDFGVPVSVREEGSKSDLVPEEITLKVYPNPFRERTVIYLDGNFQGALEIQIVDLLGRRVRTVSIPSLSKGLASIPWDGKDQSGNSLPSGMYFITAKSRTISKTVKIVHVH